MGNEYIKPPQQRYAIFTNINKQQTDSVLNKLKPIHFDC